MTRQLLLRIITVTLVASLFLCVSSSAWAAPPGPSTPETEAPPPTAPAAPAAPAPAAPPAGNPVYHLVQWGETLSKIAAYYGTTVWAIAQANGILNVNYIRAGQLLLIPVAGPAPVPGPQYYIVQPGDTLSAIAWRFGTTVWALAQANGIWNTNLIYIGQRLFIS
jgi:LysM repeat protein